MRQIVLTPQEAVEIEKEFRVVKRSVDARQKQLRVILTILDEGDVVDPTTAPLLDERQKPLDGEAIIVGAGPAGLFAALTLLRYGIKPIILERGKEVSERKKDIALLNRNEGLNPESNYCFGEGGAGTFSDGKLFSRSKKRGDMQQVMEVLHYFGAPDRILYETHAHIGSDKLPSIIRRIREYIIERGGEIHFGCRVKSLNQVEGPLRSKTKDKRLPVILAIGHSAHDTYRMLAQEGVAMEAKGCAMGVRVEHPQALINDLMYHHPSPELVSLVGNAAYSLVTQIGGRGVYSFCMCPGGHIVPAGSERQQGVVNGMSASHRNSPYANSGIVVQLPFEGDALAALEYQQKLEYTSWAQANTDPDGELRPAQRLQDFVLRRESTSLPPCSYLPGLTPSRLDQWLPAEISYRLQEGFKNFDKQYRGFVTNKALIVGVESRTSSPIRLLRDRDKLCSLSHNWLYPCDEGAGYAGGITSSALDGIKAATALAQNHFGR